MVKMIFIKRFMSIPFMKVAVSLSLSANVRQTYSVRNLKQNKTMKEELKQKMIGVIGTHSNALIESIAERCAQVAIDFILKHNPALGKSDVSSRFSDLEIAKAACRELGIDWDGEVDKYDDYRITLWSEGASWMQKALLNEG